MTHWKCPRCGHLTHIPAYELAEIGTPFCANCHDGTDVEMEPVPGETKAGMV
jgi:transcription elongation factor Elf1